MKLFLISLALFVILTNCGSETDRFIECLDGCEQEKQPGEETPTSTPEPGPPGPTGKTGTSCTIEVVLDGYDIKCGTVTAHVSNGIDGVDGNPGTDGQDGSNGVDGFSIALESMNAAPGCANGGNTIFLAKDLNNNNLVDIGVDSNIQTLEICNGLNGSDGQDGADGEDGTDGQDGVDGQDGEDGQPSEFTPTELVNPCGDAPGLYDEIFLRLANNSLVSSFSDNGNGNNTRLSILPPGNYTTTDGDDCDFTVDSNLVITNESHTY